MRKRGKEERVDEERNLSTEDGERYMMGVRGRARAREGCRWVGKGGSD